MAGANSDAQTSRRQLVNHLRLLRHYDGMARIRGHDGRAEQNVVGLDGGGGEERQRVRPVPPVVSQVA